MHTDGMIADEYGLDYTDEEIRDVIEDAVAHNRNQPRFYVLTGSHIAGFDGPESDIDIRGFHMAPAGEYAYLSTPSTEISINVDGTTEGFEAHEEIDLRSYELRKFGELLYGANYNVLEQIITGRAVMNGCPLAIDGLAELIREHLPMNVPHSYLGMAEGNYYNYLDPDKEEAYRPTARKFLYVYRGLLGAQYVLEEQDIEANVHKLAESLGDPALVDELAEHKLDRGSGDVTDDLEERAREEIVSQFNSVSMGDFPQPDKSGWREDIDEWMWKVRG